MSGFVVDADLDRDGIISMEEAFIYANEKTQERLKGREEQQFPQYISNPDIMGRVFAIDRLYNKDEYVLCIRDNIGDLFINRNTTTDIYWDSPDIWITNQKNDTDSTLHENPQFTNDSVIVNARVHNIDKEDYISGKSIEFYWAQSSSSITGDMWSGKNNYVGEQLGGFIGKIPVGPISVNESLVVSINWELPQELINQDNHPDKHYFSIFSRIVDDNIKNDESDFDALSSNRKAQSSISIINRVDSEKTASMFFTNPYSDIKDFNMELYFRNESDKDIFKFANVAADLSKTIFYYWYDLGRGNSFAIAPYTRSPYSVQFSESGSRLENIRMNGNGIGRVAMYFDFFDAPETEKTFTVDLVQRDTTGAIVGGETFIVNSPIKSFVTQSVDSIRSFDGNIILQPLTYYDSNIQWFDSNNILLSNERNLVISPKMKNQQYSMVVTSSDGELSSDKFGFALNQGIKRIAPSGYISEYLNVEFYKNDNSRYEVSINSVIDGKQIYNSSLDLGQDYLNIDTNNYPSGLYVISCFINGELLNSMLFNKR